MRGMVDAVRHVGIVVEDLERSLRFYRDVLGLTVRSSALESGPFIDHLLSLRGVAVRTCKLGVGEGGAMIELLAFENPPASPRRDISVRTPGPTHVALTVTDVSAISRAIREGGGKLIGDPRQSPDGKVVACYAQDPEGNLLELVEQAEA